MKNLSLFLFIIFVQVLSVSAQTDNSRSFWNSLEKLCGKAFAGEIVHAPENDSFRGKKLVMHVRACEETRIRIPFFVGEDRSRTWVLTKIGNRLELKHDHRHEDGKPDEVTMYGGLSSNSGSAERQVFPADEETAKMLPAASSNVWWIEVDKEGFTYNLRRVGTDRFFSIRFDLTKTIATPQAPWGWKDSVPLKLTNHKSQDRYPSFSPDGKKILFESDRNGNWDIFMMNADGTDVRQLTSNSSNERFPMFNKTGTHIVLTSDRSGDSEIYSMKIDGSDIKRWTNQKGAENFPVWSPDGKYISYTSNLDLYLLDTESLKTKKIASSEFRDVWMRWSPTGNKIAFFSRRETADQDDEIYLMDFPDGRAERITNRSGHDFCPGFSPDGSRLAVAAIDEKAGRSINIIDLEGKIITRKGLGFEQVTEPNWAPDGTKVVYIASMAGNYEIYVEDVK
jgi:dipeptidyl aminopeptidase/acylaminoacyl peptidase